MGNLILRLRRMADDAGTAVWDNDMLQTVLDEHKLHVWHEPLEMERADTSASTYEYKRFHSRWGDLEEDTSGTAYFQVQDSAGAQRGTATYTADYVRGMLMMAADQEGTALYLTGWSYDLNGAAADLWRERAAKTSSYYDVWMGEHRLSRNQWTKQCLEMAHEFERKARAETARQWTHGVFEHD